MGNLCLLRFVGLLCLTVPSISREEHHQATRTCPASGGGAQSTLYHLDPEDPNLQMFNLSSPTECCEKCFDPTTTMPCMTWSFSHVWPDTPPCHLSALAPRSISKSANCWGGSNSSTSNTTVNGSYKVHIDDTRQVLEGISFEINSDSLGQGSNPTMGNKTSGVPHDLVPSERTRFYTEMLLGFRTCRLALGLYLRGLDAEQKQIRGRWPTQMSELGELQNITKFEGFDVEYWSPPPYWKGPNQSYICTLGGHSIRSLDPEFVEEFASAMAQDVQYLINHGLNITWWGLQNEPIECVNYPSMVYNASTYHTVSKAVLPKIKALVPKARIQMGSQTGCRGVAAEVASDPVTAALVDSWTYHPGGQNSIAAMKNNSCNDSKSVWVNEFEYFIKDVTDVDTVNTAQDIMNWFVFSDSPKWTWLHALKPTYDSEAIGFSLGYWRPYDDDSNQTVPLEKGHFRYNNYTYPSLAGFLRHMPWDSTRIHVQEDVVRDGQRILAFRTPVQGKGGPRHMSTPQGLLGFVITNINPTASFNATISIQGLTPSTAASTTAFTGHRYGFAMIDNVIGTKQLTNDRTTLSVNVPPLSIEFWVQF